MTLIKSISGIRGTIGGHAGEGLNPLDIVKFTSAYHQGQDQRYIGFYGERRNRRLQDPRQNGQ